MTDNNTGFGEFASAIGAVAATGVGVATAIASGAWLPLAAGTIAGSCAAGWFLGGKLSLIAEERDRAIADLAQLKGSMREQIAELNQSLAQRNSLANKLEIYLEGRDPSLLDLPVARDRIAFLVKKIADLDKQLVEKTQLIDGLNVENQTLKSQLEQAHAEIDRLLPFEVSSDRTEIEIEREIQLRVLQSLNSHSQEMVARAVEQKVIELQQAQNVIAELTAKLDDNSLTFEDLQKNAIPSIKSSFDGLIDARDSMLRQQAGQIELLSEKIAQLEAPRQFPGITYADNAGNRIINHFAEYGVLFDAHDTQIIPGGFCLRFRVNRNADKTKLSGEEFDKLTQQCGLMGISTQSIHFKLDPQNFLISVEVFSGIDTVTRTSGVNTPDLRAKSLSTVGGLLTEDLGAVKPGKKRSQQGSQGSQVLSEQQDLHREKFVNLGCYPADQFGEVVRQKFVTRVRVCAGSTGGKSPILEMVAIELAKANNGVIWLLNPIPGSEKDWFKIPGIIQPGMDANAKIVEVFEEFHSEFQSRRNNLPSVKGKDFLLLAVDEDNATAREYEEIGTFIKDMYQLSDHVNMGFVSAGQGNNVSGLSGGGGKKGKGEEENSKKRTGNATKLMKEDFQNAVRIYTSEQAYAYLQATPLKNRAELLENLAQLNELCDRLNQEEGLKSRPAVGEAKKVSPGAYRVAFVVSPACEPFFMQLPAYSSLSLDGLRFPAESRVTSPHWKEGPQSAAIVCPHCNSTIVHLRKPYADGGLRYQCGNRPSCGKVFRYDRTQPE